MHRKVERKSQISLGKAHRVPNMDCVSIYQEGLSIFLTPYQKGDEFKDGIVARHFDRKGRVVIPREFLTAIGAEDHVEITALENGTLRLTALDARCVGLQPKNGYNN